MGYAKREFVAIVSKELPCEQALSFQRTGW